MKILVNEMPKGSSECLFRDYHSFGKSTVCSLDCGKECEYLMTPINRNITSYKEVLE